MDETKLIAERVVGLRESLNLTTAEMAEKCSISESEYNELELGDRGVSVSLIHNIAEACHIEPSVILFGNEPHMSSYSLTRRGKGITIERQKKYKYQSLAAGFQHKSADPFIVTVEPSDGEISTNIHPGQEFNMVIEGTLCLIIDGKELILNEGDSIYFNSAKPHGMKALNNTRVKFLAIIIKA